VTGVYIDRAPRAELTVHHRPVVSPNAVE